MVVVCDGDGGYDDVDDGGDGDDVYNDDDDDVDDVDDDDMMMIESGMDIEMMIMKSKKECCLNYQLVKLI